MAATSLALRAASVLGTVEGSSDENDSGKKKTFTQYTVRVETQNGQQWTTAKRYTEFKQLEAELDLAGIVVAGAKLPKKKLRNTSSVIAKRQHSLQDWLSHAIVQYPDHGILLQFLAPPSALAESSPAERAPPPEQFSDIFALFEQLAEANGDGVPGEASEAPMTQQLLARTCTSAKLDAAIGVLQAETEIGGRLAVGFCCAGGAQEAVVLLERSVGLLDRKALAAVQPDSPPVVGALSALQLLGLLALDGDWRSNNRFIYNGCGCTEPMAASIAAALGVCIACTRCCSLVRAAYHYMTVAAATQPVAAAFAGEAPQHAVVSTLLLGLLDLLEPTSWGVGNSPVCKKKQSKEPDMKEDQTADLVRGPDGRFSAPYRAFQVLPVSRLAEETERGAEEAQKALLKMPSSKGIKSQQQYEKDQEAARLTSGIMTVGQRKEAAVVDSVLVLAALESNCEVTRRLLLQLLPPVMCFALRRIATETRTYVRVPHAEVLEPTARPDSSVLRWINAFALSTTRSARCFWTESHRMELRARCNDQKRRAEVATVDGQVDAAAAGGQLAGRSRWDSVQPVYQASAGQLVLLGYNIGILLEEAQDRGYSEMNENSAAGAAGEEKLLKAAMDRTAQCLIDTPIEEQIPEAVAGAPLLEQLEMPSTELPLDVGENLEHLRMLIQLFGLVLNQEKKRAKTIELLLGHVGCLTQLCAVAGGHGQCDETLQLQALRLLQQTASTQSKPPKVKQTGGGSGKIEKGPLVGAILGSVEDMLTPLLQGLRVRPIRPSSTVILLQLLESLTAQAPKLLTELLNQDSVVSLLGLVASSDATEQIHEETSKLLRTMSQSALYGHRVEATLATFLPQAVVAAMLAEPRPVSNQLQQQDGIFRLGSEHRTPTLIWTRAMNTSFREAINVALVASPQATGTLPPERPKVEYPELSKDQYIGGVYLREFLRVPHSELQSVEKFAAALMEAHLVHAVDSDGVKKLGPICAATLTAVTLHPEMADHLANLGYIERLLEDPLTLAHAHARKALLKFLVVLSLHSQTACDRFSRDGVGVDALFGIFKASEESEGLRAEVLNSMQSLVAGSGDAVHVDLTAQLVEGGWIELVFDEVLDTRHASAPLRVAGVGLIKEMLRDKDPTTVGAVKTRLKAYSQWREYAGSDHALFVPTETVDEVRADVLLLEDCGAGGIQDAAHAAQTTTVMGEADDDEDIEL